MKISPLLRGGAAALLCCAAVALAAAPPDTFVSPWQALPDVPQALSGRFAGVHNGALIVAGGSRFPKSLFEGGVKEFSDRVDVLTAPDGRWRNESVLERPLALGASVSTDGGVVCLGGGDAARHYPAAFRLRWTGSGVERTPLPDLPRPVAFLGAARLGNAVYAVGGHDSPAATEALRTFWRLDLARSTPAPRWEELPPWPGPGRIGPAVAAQAGCLYVFGGASLHAGPDGKPARTYLKDAYRYRPGEGWKRVADLPRPLVAAPALAEGDRLIRVFGGDDGEHAARVFELKEKHPGFRKEVLVYDTAADRWSAEPTPLPFGLVTTHAVRWGDRVVIPGGEDRPGHRSAWVLARTASASVRGGNRVTAVEGEGSVVQTPLFVSGTGGYHTYRIPSLIATKRGTLLAFCEGRKNGGGDSGDIDLVLRRSTDGGETWGPLQVVWDDGGNTCGNPCPVVDENTGDVVLLMTHNLGEDHESEINAGTSKGTRTVWVTRSKDDGVTWAAPREITRDAKKPDWTWYATGPGVAVQIRKGPHRGRLVVPCNHNEGEKKVSVSHCIYSDDGGETWKLGGNSPQGKTNESQMAELSDGRLMLNMRSADRSRKERSVCLSADGGETWTDFRYDPTLIEPICQGSLLSGAALKEASPSTLLFSNPAHDSLRRKMTVRLSRDDGKTWPLSRTLHDGHSAYSSLTVLPGGEALGCLYERGVERSYETVTFARFPAPAEAAERP